MDQKQKTQEMVQEAILNQSHSNLIFAEIKRINKEMTERMKFRIDIEKKAMVAGEKVTSE